MVGRTLRAMKTALVILGAGASRGVDNGTSPLKTGHAGLKPPLANDLFDGSGPYWNVVNRYEGVKVLGATLGAAAQSGTFSLEEKLREYASSDDPEIRRHFRDVPLYLRDLIKFVQSSYIELPGRTFGWSPHC